MNESFEQLYQQLSEQHRPQLETIRKSIVRKLWIAGFLGAAVVVLILWLLPLGEYIIHIITSLFIAFFAYKYFLKRPYILYFREHVAKNFVALVDSSLSYSPEPPDNWRDRILVQYRTARFDGRGLGDSTRRMEPADTMGSPGLSNFIAGEIEGRPFQLCCMSMQATGKNDKTKFKGLFVSMKVSKSLNGFIKIERRVRRARILGTGFIPKAERRKMDHTAFEREFFVGSNDQVTAMQYLTADVMELLLNFKSELIDIQTRFNRNLFPQNPNMIRLDLFWRSDQVSMRIGNKKMFKPTMQDPMCKDSLACCLSSLAFATRFNQVITKSIKETAI